MYDHLINPISYDVFTLLCYLCDFSKIIIFFQCIGKHLHKCYSIHITVGYYPNMLQNVPLSITELCFAMTHGNSTKDVHNFIVLACWAALCNPLLKTVFTREQSVQFEWSFELRNLNYAVYTREK